LFYYSLLRKSLIESPVRTHFGTNTIYGVGAESRKITLQWRNLANEIETDCEKSISHTVDSRCTKKVS